MSSPLQKKRRILHKQLRGTHPPNRCCYIIILLFVLVETRILSYVIRFLFIFLGKFIGRGSTIQTVPFCSSHNIFWLKLYYHILLIWFPLCQTNKNYYFCKWCNFIIIQKEKKKLILLINNKIYTITTISRKKVVCAFQYTYHYILRRL